MLLKNFDRDLAINFLKNNSLNSKQKPFNFNYGEKNMKIYIKTPEQLEKKQNFGVEIRIKSETDSTLMNFEMKIKYLTDYVKLIKKSLKKTLFSYKFNENLLIINLKPKKQINLKANEEMEILKIDFKLINFDSNSLRFDLETENGNVFSEVKLIKPEIFLEKLVPSKGALRPDFSPGTTEYSVDVPYDIKNLTFDAQGSGEIKINRTKLNKAGKETEFKIKIKNKEAKKEYKIRAKRAEKPKTIKVKTITTKMVKAKTVKTKTIKTEAPRMNEKPTETEHEPEKVEYKEITLCPQRNESELKYKNTRLAIDIALTLISILAVSYAVFTKKKKFF